MREYSFDYCFLGDEFRFKLTLMVGHERMPGVRLATAVPMKGSTGRFTIEKIIEYVDE